MKKLKLLFLFFSLASSLQASALDKPHIPAGPNTGILFIHGTSDHSQDAEGGYWKSDLIDGVVSALPNPNNYFVAHCDFTHYMWHEDSAGCLASQAEQFIEEKKIEDLIVITHSDGANVMRWMMSNPSYDSRYPKIIDKIRWVNAIAPSSSGTPLADDAIDGTVFEAAVGWLLGYTTNAVKQQRVGDMAIFNDTLLDGSEDKASLPKPFYVIVGTDVSASPISGHSYCGGYTLNLGLKVTKLYLDKCADGFLNCSSQAAAGTVWFYDQEKTDNQEQLNHNQSRTSCFGLDKILIRDFQ